MSRIMHYFAYVACLTVTHMIAGQAISNSGALSVCDVLREPLRFNGQIIIVKGVLVETDEGSWLTGPECPGVFHTNQHVWPSFISLSIPPVPRALHMVAFSFDQESNRRARSEYKRLLRKHKMDSICWLVEGLFESRTDWERFRAIYPSGESRYNGFGHQSSAPAQLIMKSVKGVVAN